MSSWPWVSHWPGPQPTRRPCGSVAPPSGEADPKIPASDRRVTPTWPWAHPGSCSRSGIWGDWQGKEGPQQVRRGGGCSLGPRQCGCQRPVPGPGLFSECYSNSEDRAFALLVRRNRCWSRTTCLHLATEADTKAFFAHDGVQVSLWLRGGQIGGARSCGAGGAVRGALLLGGARLASFSLPLASPLSASGLSTALLRPQTQPLPVKGSSPLGCLGGQRLCLCFRLS